ncbi:MAG TPA: glycosyltransferase [Solirubrobacteraceae bacterium]
MGVTSQQHRGASSQQHGTDVLVVVTGGTTGWGAAARELSVNLAGAGARVELVSTGPTPQVRTFMLTDLTQAWMARAATRRAIAAHHPAAIVYCSITAALLWPRPGAVWLDAIAAENRPGRHGVWQRIMERRRLAQAPLIMTMAPNSLESLRGRPHADTVEVPVAIERSGQPAGERDVDVLAYTGDPVKRRLDLILAAWERARRSGETLVVAGLPSAEEIPGVRFVGRLEPAAYRELLRRARVFVTAPRREDFGIAALEALADGCLLVTTPSPGPYPALGLARQLDPRLVSEDLAPALRTALDDPAEGYAARARELLAPFGRAAVQETLARRALPRLLPGWKP